MGFPVDLGLCAPWSWNETAQAGSLRYLVLIFAREVFRVEEKAETFTKGVKSVAPENSIHPQGLVRALE